MTTETAKTRGIIMSAESVRAISAGAKTQTRRVNGLEDVNAYPGRLTGEGVMGPLGYRGLCGSDLYVKQKWDYAKCPGLYHWFHGEQTGVINPIPVKCPYGRVGDRLWVKHPARISGRSANGFLVTDEGFDDGPPNGRFFYWHDFPYRVPAEGKRFGRGWPRVLSRLTLEIVSVKVDRVQDISEADAAAEGCDGKCPVGSVPAYRAGPMSYHFAQRWDALNGERPGCSWSANPWVWCLSFVVVPQTEVDRAK